MRLFAVITLQFTLKSQTFPVCFHKEKSAKT